MTDDDTKSPFHRLRDLVAAAGGKKLNAADEVTLYQRGSLAIIEIVENASRDLNSIAVSLETIVEFMEEEAQSKAYARQQKASAP